MTIYIIAHKIRLSKRLSCRLVRHPSGKKDSRQAGMTQYAQKLMTLCIVSIMALSLFVFQIARASAAYNSHFGILVNPYIEDWTDPDKTTKLLKELGVKLVISKLSWKNIEPEKGK